MNAAATVRYFCTVIAACALLAFALPARAQQPSANALAQARELVGIIGAAREFEPVVTNIIVQSAGVFLQSNPRLAKDLTEIAEQLVAEYQPRSDELPNEIIKLFATRFTEQELKDALTFYKSPLGKKLLSESANILGEAVKRAEVFAAKLREEITAKIRAELKKRGHNL